MAETHPILLSAIAGFVCAVAALSGTAFEFDPLPHGVHLTMAIRRAIRSGRSDGIPIEDLGIRGIPYALTRRDLLEGNTDLLTFCARALRDWS